ncbi:hypothetical protein B296_00000807 [Ensete ventricosum]|uniref:Uncharacterized protein n=1 Tax=Ensete ventricosum TaxID=4639 RepID=A0A427ALJ4_ENSVE|nr:hypothetical protein B296_00000807 [Ensete ventricosum]
MKTQLKALEIRIENQLKKTLNDFKRNLLENLSKFQQEESSNLMLNRSGDTKKGHKEQDTNYPRMKV